MWQILKIIANLLAIKLLELILGKTSLAIEKNKVNDPNDYNFSDKEK